jgi:hypothetical protein
VLTPTGAHGQRYEVNGENERKLGGLVEQGRKTLRQWMLKNQIPDNVITEFDRDDYHAGFVHIDVPERVMLQLDQYK